MLALKSAEESKMMTRHRREKCQMMARRLQGHKENVMRRGKEA